MSAGYPPSGRRKVVGADRRGRALIRGGGSAGDGQDDRGVQDDGGGGAQKTEQVDHCSLPNVPGLPRHP